MKSQNTLTPPQTMRTVLAVRNKDGHLELLEPVDLPVGKKLPILVPLAPSLYANKGGTLPVRKLGPIKGRLTRDEIYAHLL